MGTFTVAKIKLCVSNTLTHGSTCAVATGGPGGTVPPLTAACTPYLGLLKILLLEHYSMARQHTMLEKGIITFKHNSPLTFFRFFATLLAINCCT